MWGRGSEERMREAEREMEKETQRDRERETHTERKRWRETHRARENERWRDKRRERRRERGLERECVMRSSCQFSCLMHFQAKGVFSALSPPLCCSTSASVSRMFLTSQFFPRQCDVQYGQNLSDSILYCLRTSV